jgi:hypothetical protein
MCITWFGGIHHSSVCFQHSIVDQRLVLGELPVDGERACDVRSIATIGRSHIKQTKRKLPSATPVQIYIFTEFKTSDLTFHKKIKNTQNIQISQGSTISRF